MIKRKGESERNGQELTLIPRLAVNLFVSYTINLRDECY